jgi:hypothetical protein
LNNFCKIFKEKKFVLISSLPENNPELAKAAVNSGTDVLKVHINVVHHASGTAFGSLAEEKTNLEKIISVTKNAGVPVGIVPGAKPGIGPCELNPLVGMGFDFFSIYAAHLSPTGLDLKEIGKMVALDSSYHPYEAKFLAKMGVDACEASVIPGNGYGYPLSVQDLLKYQCIVQEFNGAVIVPTQRVIKPTDLSPLIRTGVRGLMIGAVVAGKEVSEFEKSVRSYRKAIEKYENNV